MDIPGLSLSPEQARVVGLWALFIFVTLDILSAGDGVPFNGPRDWLLWLTQRKIPLRAVPLTGAWVPFMSAAAVGHFFHPGLGPLVGPGGFAGLGILIGAAAVVSLVAGFAKPGGGPRLVFLLAVGGLLGGMAVWPVSD